MTDVPNDELTTDGASPRPGQPRPGPPRPGAAVGRPVGSVGHDAPVGRQAEPVEHAPVEAARAPQPDDFAARTAAVEQQPLADRADGFSALHDELRTRLESGGSTSA